MLQMPNDLQSKIVEIIKSKLEIAKFDTIETGPTGVVISVIMNRRLLLDIEVYDDEGSWDIRCHLKPWSTRFNWQEAILMSDLLKKTGLKISVIEALIRKSLDDLVPSAFPKAM